MRPRKKKISECGKNQNQKTMQNCNIAEAMQCITLFDALLTDAAGSSATTL